MINIKQTKNKTLQGVHILVAEDVEANYLFLEAFLKDEGAKLYWAKNGEEALNIVNANKIHAILMDLKMPVLDGFEATKLIKALKPDIPIFALTAYAFSHDKKRALDNGCNEYLVKPIQPKLLLEIIKKYTCGVSR